VNRQVTDLLGGFRTVHQGIEQPTLRVLSSAMTRPPSQILSARGTSNRRDVSITTNGFVMKGPWRRTCEV
jgi:hypothetical protein